MSTSTLKPCPFCGGEPEVERHGDRRQSCIVACTDCGCRLESNEAGAGANWNRRARRPPPDQPTVVISTSVTPFGWTTTVRMPEGKPIRRAMKWESPGVFRGTRKGDFADDDLPDCVVEAMESFDAMDIVKFLSE